MEWWIIELLSLWSGAMAIFEEGDLGHVISPLPGEKLQVVHWFSAILLQDFPKNPCENCITTAVLIQVLKYLRFSHLLLSTS